MSSSGRSIRLMALFCCAAMLLCASARADVLKPAASLPADIDTLVVIENAAELRQTEAGAGIGGIARSLFAEGAAAKRWAAFSSQLGWTPEEAFDALLGRRMILVARKPWSGEATWAVLCDVSRATEKRLRTRLNFAPRKIYKGHTIYAVEDGNFELTFERRGDRATLLVAQRDRAGLFDELTPLLANPPRDSFLATEPAQRLKNMRGDAAMIFTRMGQAKSGWLAARISLDGDNGVVASLTMEGMASGMKPVRWSTAVFERLARDRLLCVIDRRATVDEAGEIDQAALSLMTKMLPWMAPPKDLEATLGDLQAVVADGGEQGGLRIGAALQSTDIHAMPKPGDRMMRDMLVNLSTELDAGAWEFDYGGRWPKAVLSARLLEEGAPLIAGEGLEVVWRYAADAPAGAGEDADSGWLVMATDRATLDGVAERLTTPHDTEGKVGEWSSVGMARPAELRIAIKKAAAIPPALDVLGFVEQVKWRIECVGSSGARGIVHARFLDGE